MFSLIHVLFSDIFVDNKLVSQGDAPTPLNHESIIVVGDTIMIFQLPVTYEDQKKQWTLSGSKMVFEIHIILYLGTKYAHEYINYELTVIPAESLSLSLFIYIC